MFEQRINRRRFLGAIGAAGATSVLAGSGDAAGFFAEDETTLAIDGGTPVRSTTLSSGGPYGPQFYDEVEEQELLDVLESRRPFRHGGAGSKVRQFEREYAAHIDVKHVLGVTSGTTALMTTMAAFEIGPGDEVILPAWTWYADYDAVVLAGALPVFAEIDESFGLDPADIEHRITPRTKLIVPSHLQGCPCDLDSILEIANDHNLGVVEDCAQCVGGKYKGRYVGTIGDMGIYSFQQSKTITSGEGGAVSTNDSELFERAVRFHNVGGNWWHGEEIDEQLAPFAASNFRMSEFTGAVLRGQLQKLEDTICEPNRACARKVREAIADLPGMKLRKQHDPEGDTGEWVFWDMGTEERASKFRSALDAEGIPASRPGGSVILPTASRIENKVTVHPDWPSFQTPHGQAIEYGASSCPRTIDILDRAVGVRMSPRFTEEDLEDIVRAITKVYRAIGPA